MKTKLNLLAAGIFMAAGCTGYGQNTLQFSANIYTVAENAGSVILTVQRTGDTNAVVSVDYASTNGTALAGSDYTATNGTLTFAAGETNQTIAVSILNDGIVEPAAYETFTVTLSNPTGGAVLGTRATTTVRITDNDVSLQFEFGSSTFGSYRVGEGEGFIVLGVVRADDGNFPVGVDFATSDLTAINGLDYTGVTNTLFFPAGEKVQLITVPILNDGLKESSETFRVTLSNPTNQILGSQKIATVTIGDNDAGVQFQPAYLRRVAENERAVTLTVVRGNDGNLGPITVDFATSNLTATAGSDYTATNGTLTFAQGEMAKTVTVPILNDEVREAGEQFEVTLNNPTGDAVLSPFATATVTILDNDAGVQFQPLNRYWIAENEGALVLTVVRVNDGNLGPFTVDFATSNLTATAGTDYTATNGTLTFAQGEMAKTVTVPILHDEVREAGEQLKVTLTNPTGDAVLGPSATVTVTIVDPSAIAAPGSWTQKADLPAPAGPTASCVVDGILYVIGGGNPFDVPLRTVWAYNPQMDSWTRKADMPAARQFLAAAAVDGIIYVVGGIDVRGSPLILPVAAYNPTTDTWMNRANIPTGRAALAACAVDGILYAIGGSQTGTRLSTVEAYDPRTDQWTRKSSLPKTAWFLTASVVDGRVYVFEGTDTFSYDPKTDHWTAKAQHFPWSRALMSGTVDGIIYLFGGMTEDMYGSFDFTLAYDPTQDQFTTRRKMPRTRLGAGWCGVIDGKVYLAGGASEEPAVNPDYVFYKVLDVFDPRGGMTPQILSLACESTNHVRLSWQGEAGILYGVQSRPNVANGPWTRATFSSGTNSVLATNSMVEVTCLLPTADTNRFFRVLEL